MSKGQCDPDGGLPPLCASLFDQIQKKQVDLECQVKELDKAVRNGLSGKVNKIHTHVVLQWFALGLIGVASMTVFAAVVSKFIK